MRKKSLISVLCLSIVLTLSGCQMAGQKQEVTKDDTRETANEQQKEVEKEDEWVENPIPEEAQPAEVEMMSNAEIQMYINAIQASDPLNLTTEQKLEDFDVLWNTIREKVYCLDEIAEFRGVNVKKHIADYREKVANSKDDIEFYTIMEKSVSLFRGVWHINLNSPYQALSTGVSLSKDSNTIKNTFEEENQKILKYWDTLLSQNIYNYKYGKIQMASSSPMPELRIINDTTAVISVPTLFYLSDDMRKKAGDLLIECMKEVADFENVIFDLKSNGGGSESFAFENLIAPNIDEKITFSRFKFFKYTEDIKNRRPEGLKKSRKGRENYVGWIIYPDRPLSELPEDTRMTDGEYGNADFYAQTDIEIYPRYNRKILNGKIWVLTYPENYSSSESFIAVCKDTGFATLVGSQTGGDGIGEMPHWYVLPNSRLSGVVSYMWGLNDDGTNNSNEGTKPDIESPENETPLETCLREIEEYENKK